MLWGMPCEMNPEITSSSACGSFMKEKTIPADMLGDICRSSTFATLESHVSVSSDLSDSSFETAVSGDQSMSSFEYVRPEFLALMAR